MTTNGGLGNTWCAGYFPLIAPLLGWSLDDWRERILPLEERRNPLPLTHHQGAIDMPKKTSEPVATQQWGGPPPALVPATCNDITPADAPVGAGNSNPVTNERTTEAPQQADSPPTQDTSTKHRAVSRGLAASISTKLLKDRIWTGALLMANRFRVIRTIDVAMLFPERNFKASLTAAQRAVRGLVKAQLLKRYRSDRFQHYCGISKRGVDWLEEAGFEASSSVRRASDMTNPEHRLWAQFWTLACEARGLSAMTEQELLRHLNKDVLFGQPLVQGYLTVATMRGKVSRQIQLRPDAICREPDDGSTTWCETDLSLRGAQRLSSLHALCSSVGRSLKDSTVLRNVVVFCKTERIQKRALNVLSEQDI